MKNKYCYYEGKDRKINHKFISITSRISLKDSQAGTFKKNHIDFIDYQHMSEYDLNQSNSFIISIDSLFRLEYFDASNYIIFLDEVNSMLTHIGSFENMKERRSSLNALKNLLTNCKQFIAVDADMSDLVYNTLNMMNLQYTKVHNTYEPLSGLKAFEKNDLNHMYEMIKNETSCVCCFDSASEARKLQIYLQNEGINENVFAINDVDEDKILIHTAEKKSGNLYDISKDWADKIVIYSPSIVYGLDFVPSKATNVYLFAGMSNKTTINPLNMVQQIMRTRKINNIYYHFSKNRVCVPFERSLSEVYEFYEQRNKIVFNTLFPIEHPFASSCDDFDIENALLQNNIFKCIHTYITFNDIVFNSNPKVHFEKLLKGKQIKVIRDKINVDSVNLEKDLTKLLKNTLKDVRDDEYIQWVDGALEIEKFTRLIEILKITNEKDKYTYKEIIKNPLEHFQYRAIMKTKEKLMEIQENKLQTFDHHEMLLKSSNHKAIILKTLEASIGIHEPFIIINNPHMLYDGTDLKNVYGEYKKTFRLTPTSFKPTTESIFKDIIKIYQHMTKTLIIAKQIQNNHERTTNYFINHDKLELHNQLLEKITKKQTQSLFINDTD